MFMPGNFLSFEEKHMMLLGAQAMRDSCKRVRYFPLGIFLGTQAH